MMSLITNFREVLHVKSKLNERDMCFFSSSIRGIDVFIGTRRIKSTYMSIRNLIQFTIQFFDMTRVFHCAEEGDEIKL